SLSHTLAQLAHESWRCVRHDGDDAVASCRHDRERELVVTGEDAELVRPLAEDVGDLAESAGRFLDGDDAWRGRERERRLRLDIASGATGNVVDDNWEIDGVRDRAVVRD